MVDVLIQFPINVRVHSNNYNGCNYVLMAITEYVFGQVVRAIHCPHPNRLKYSIKFAIGITLVVDALLVDICEGAQSGRVWPDCDNESVKDGLGTYEACIRTSREDATSLKHARHPPWATTPTACSNLPPLPLRMSLALHRPTRFWRPSARPFQWLNNLGKQQPLQAFLHRRR